jgi:hypothetical protein
MPTNAKTKARKAAERASAAPRSRSSGGPDAIALLEQDHRDVESWFGAYEDLEDDVAKLDLARRICLALKVHTRLEEEQFYPPARKATKDNDLIDEAVVEHAGAKNLIAEIESMRVGDPLYDAKVKVLGEMVKHHVQEEEDELFPEVRETGLDLVALGAKMAARKAELMAELSAPPLPRMPPTAALTTKAATASGAAAS